MFALSLPQLSTIKLVASPGFIFFTTMSLLNTTTRSREELSLQDHRGDDGLRVGKYGVTILQMGINSFDHLTILR